MKMTRDEQIIYDLLLDYPGETVTFLFKQTFLPIEYLLKIINRLEMEGAIWVDRGFVDPGIYRCYPIMD